MLLLLLLAGCLLAACWLLTLAAPQGKDDGCGNFSCFPRLMNETAAISRPVRVRQSSPFPSSRHAAKDARNRHEGQLSPSAPVADHLREQIPTGGRTIGGQSRMDVCSLKQQWA